MKPGKPSIVRLVALLAANGFGRDGDDCGEPLPTFPTCEHVFISVRVADSSKLVSEAKRLHAILTKAGVGPDANGMMHAAYDPEDDAATIDLLGLSDADLTVGLYS